MTKIAVYFHVTVHLFYLILKFTYCSSTFDVYLSFPCVTSAGTAALPEILPRCATCCSELDVLPISRYRVLLYYERTYPA